jgi:hypothetical protein
MRPIALHWIGRHRIADHMQCLHYARMSIQITIWDVSEKVRDQLAFRAALQGKSMHEYLSAELERLAACPSIDVAGASAQEKARSSNPSFRPADPPESQR